VKFFIGPAVAVADSMGRLINNVIFVNAVSRGLRQAGILDFVCKNSVVGRKSLRV